MSQTVDLSTAEQRAYELIITEDGVLQSQLWKALDEDSRKGSRLAQSLEEKGVIERKPTTHDGQRTYLLNPKDDQDFEEPTSTGEQKEASPEERPEDTLTEREERALDLIRENRGMYQSEFWKALDVNSRTGSRIATTLEEKGKVRRVETTHNGRRTYYLSLMPRELDFSLLMAGDMISPLVNSDEKIDPVNSDEFTKWILNLSHTER